jgi:hypothetical protein
VTKALERLARAVIIINMLELSTDEIDHLNTYKDDFGSFTFDSIVREGLELIIS